MSHVAVMTPSPFGLYLEVESSSLKEDSSHLPLIPAAPEKALPRTYHSVAQAPPDAIELDNLQWGVRLTGPLDAEAEVPSPFETTLAADDLEMSRPVTPNQENEGFEALQTVLNPPMNRFRMLAVCILNFSMGLNDSAPGALIPYIESHYNIGYAIVSLIFITNAVGFISAAFIVEALRARFGRSRTLMLANAFLVCAYIPIVCTPLFPVVACCFFLLGLGNAISLALGNVFTGNLQNSTEMLGLMHGSYGLGGTIGPLIATAMVTSGRLIWSRFYIITLGWAVFNIGFAGWSFWKYEKEFPEQAVRFATLRSARHENQGTGSLENDGDQPAVSRPPYRPKGRFSPLAKSFKSKVILLGALFIFAYQGAEVSISGWVISFLLATRNGDPSSVGYVTSGFWGGITLGRFILSHPAHKVGEKIFVYGVVVGAAAFQMLVWFVPNIVGDAVAVAIVGLLLGPVYPCAAAVFTRTIPRSSQVSGLGVISAFGSSGGAVAPFMTGILAQAIGTFVLHPIAIGLFAVMLGSWYGVPNIRKRRE